MLEPYIKLNQNKCVKAAKLKEIDQKLAEIVSYKKLLENNFKKFEKISSIKNRQETSVSLNEADTNFSISNDCEKSSM